MFALKFQAGEIAVFIPWRGCQPRNLARSLGGAGDFCLMFSRVAASRGGRVSYRVEPLSTARSQQLAERLSGVCSLSNFRLARSRSLSLGAGASRGIWRGEMSNKRKQGDC